MVMAVLASIAATSIHCHYYNSPCRWNSLGCMVAGGLKTPGLKRFLIPVKFNSGIELESRYSSSSSLSSVSKKKKLRISSIRSESETASGEEKVPFGYTRKDVLLIGLGLTIFGVGLKYGLELIGVDSLKAGNVVQLVMVLGLTIGWIFTYIFRVSTKDMTYAQQLRDYENKVMQKRLEELPEAELEVLLAEVEEEKERINKKRDRLNLE